MKRQASSSVGSDPDKRLQGHGPSPPRSGGESELLLFVRAVTEGMALLVGLLAIETLFLGRGAYAALDVHPFWLPVILVSLQHGLYGGVATAALASWFMDWPLRAPGVDISTYNLEMAHLPIQWFLCALLIGLYRQSERRKQAEQARELTRLRHRNQVFADEIHRIDEELWRFEVAAATASPAAAEEPTAREGESGAPGAQAQVSVCRQVPGHGPANALVASVARLLGIVEARLFLRGAAGQYRDASEGDPSPVLGSVLGADHPLVRRAVALGAPVVIDHTDGAGGAIAAVAVRDQTEGTLRGLIAIPCSGGNTTGVTALMTLADATSAMLARMDESCASDRPREAIGAAR